MPHCTIRLVYIYVHCNTYLRATSGSQKPILADRLIAGRPSGHELCTRVLSNKKVWVVMLAFAPLRGLTIRVDDGR